MARKLFDDGFLPEGLNFFSLVGRICNPSGVTETDCPVPVTPDGLQIRPTTYSTIQPRTISGARRCAQAS